MRPSSSRIVALVSSDRSSAPLLAQAIRGEGHHCAVFADTAALLADMHRQSIGVVLLRAPSREAGTADLMIALRVQYGYSVTVIALVDDATSTGAGAGALLDIGVDVCLPLDLPTSLMIAHVAAGLRRATPQSAAIDAAVGHLRFQSHGMRIYSGDTPVMVTAKEYALALMLCRNIGKVLSRDDIFRAIWSDGPRPATRSLDVHISRLRAKLGLTPEHGFRLTALYGRGYRLEHFPGREGEAGRNDKADRPRPPVSAENDQLHLLSRP